MARSDAISASDLQRFSRSRAVSASICCMRCSRSAAVDSRGSPTDNAAGVAFTDSIAFTCGSDGAAYLDSTALKYRVFPEIWAARTLLLPPDMCPPVQNRAFYGFQH